MSENPASRSGDEDFRWQAFFQRTTEPLFILNRQCYLLFVNHAWEQLTGFTAQQVKRMSCRRSKPPGGRASWRTVLSHVLTPSEEVKAGQGGRARRLIPARGSRSAAWWDVDFLPLMDENGLRGVVGKISPFTKSPATQAIPVPQALATLRERILSSFRADRLIIRLPAMERVQRQIRLATNLHDPVLLIGAQGTGKKTLARMMHFQSDQREGAFAALDCQRLPPVAIEAVLFGESKAAEAVRTVYLREPASLPQPTQSRLVAMLRERQQREEHGGSHPRLIAGTMLTERGSMMPELYHALSTFCIHVPTLKERRDDLPHLIDQQLQQMSEYRKEAPDSLSANAWELVLSYPWPGNLRELSDALKLAASQCTGKEIDVAHFPSTIRKAAGLKEVPVPPGEQKINLKETLEEVERRLITLALQQSGGQRQKAADNLQIWRAVLLRRIKALGIDIPAPASAQNKRREQRQSKDSDEGEDISF